MRKANQAVGFIVVLIAGAVFLWPTIQQSMDRASDLHRRAAEYADAVARHLATPAWAVSRVSLGPNLNTVDVVLRVPDTEVSHLTVEAVQQAVEFVTGRRLDVINVRLTGETVDRQWRWDSTSQHWSTIEL